jgi:hypothetical protein
MIAAALAAGVILGGVAPPRVALTVSPAHLTLAAGAKATVRVAPAAGARLVLRCSVTGLRLDARGHPAIGGAPDAAAWLKVTPATVSVGSSGASFVVSSRRAAHARPGDHVAILLLTATVPGSKGVAVGMRVGLVVTVAVKGRLTRHVAVVAVHGRREPGGRSLVSVTLVNRGDVIESVGGPLFQVRLSRHGRVLARPRVARRKILPRSTAVLTFRCRARGVVVVRIVPGSTGRHAPARSFRLRM